MFYLVLNLVIGKHVCLDVIKLKYLFNESDIFK